MYRYEFGSLANACSASMASLSSTPVVRSIVIGSSDRSLSVSFALTSHSTLLAPTVCTDPLASM